ncbi:olfactory receptor 11A1-like [Anabas testudineus]|uniref:olfactory receptor 11A1-like n=1 Tax=Anabas testudineus TaxID=64144 RepID=UPI000E45EB1D|nr:olfactory receptor 11A1-like [Anabas testudineus]
MENELNVTYITLGGFVDMDKYKYLYFSVVFTAFILIIWFNVTIICLIWIHRNLHEPMYIFIAALLLNSVLYSTNIYPKLLVDFLSEKQIISYSACLFQFFIIYSLVASEFLLLTAMSYDRYVSICKPLQYSTIMRRRTVSIILVLAWLVPACEISILVILSADMKLCNLTLNGISCNNAIYSLHCENSKTRSALGVVVLTITALLPLHFILFTYTRILIISYRSSRNVRRKAAQTCLPHLLVLISFSCLCAFDVTIVRLGSDFPKTVHFIISLQTIFYHPLFNPIIYGLKMKEISKHLKKLFCGTKIM